MTKWTPQPTGSLTTLALPTEESGMYLPPEVTDRELPSLIRRFKEITGWSPWQKRLAWLEAGVKQTVRCRISGGNGLNLNLPLRPYTNGTMLRGGTREEISPSTSKDFFHSFPCWYAATKD